MWGTVLIKMESEVLGNGGVEIVFNNHSRAKNKDWVELEREKPEHAQWDPAKRSGKASKVKQMPRNSDFVTLEVGSQPSWTVWRGEKSYCLCLHWKDVRSGQEVRYVRLIRCHVLAWAQGFDLIRE